MKYDEDALVERESSESECCSRSGSAGGAGWGKFLRYSRMSSVRRPMPMAVKKLMAKRVCTGLSLGNMPVRLGCNTSSRSLVARVVMPIAWEISSKSILMKIREEDVVSSSLRWMMERTCQPIPSLLRRCPKN